jgi:hypothetical protein
MTITCTDVLGHPKTIETRGTVTIENAGIEFPSVWIQHHYPDGAIRVDMAHGDAYGSVSHLEVG